jgi:hypothetical protein
VNAITYAIVQWASQGLICVGGVWALLSDTTARGADGRKRLTGSGWANVGVLGLGLVLFALTEIKSAEKQREERLAREEDIRRLERLDASQRQELDSISALGTQQQTVLGGQATHLTGLQRLFLLQHRLSDVELSWPLTAEQRRQLEDSVSAAKSRLPQTAPVQTTLEYLKTAIRHGRIEVERSARGRWMLQVVLGRPQGLLVDRQPEGSAAWSALEAGLQGLLRGRFQLEASSGVVLVDPARRDWPCSVLIADDSITLRVDAPDIQIGVLANATVHLRSDGGVAGNLPRAVLVSTHDPRVSLRSVVPAAWTPETIYSYVSEDRPPQLFQNVRTGPVRLAASIQPSLLRELTEPIPAPGSPTRPVP